MNMLYAIMLIYIVSIIVIGGIAIIYVLIKGNIND